MQYLHELLSFAETVMQNLLVALIPIQQEWVLIGSGLFTVLLVCVTIVHFLANL